MRDSLHIRLCFSWMIEFMFFFALIPETPTEGELVEIKGKKIRGVGLGNIFGEGGPKLRKAEQRDSPEPPKPLEEKIEKVLNGCAVSKDTDQSWDLGDQCLVFPSAEEGQPSCCA